MRHSQATDLPIFKGIEQARRIARLRLNRVSGSSFFLHRVNLNASDIWVNGDAMAASPMVCIVMLIDPKQAIHVAHIRLKHNAAHIVVDSHRAHVRVRRIANPFVVDARCHRILAEFGDKIQNRHLL
ncbi:hypothetical protein D9M70_450260 [compost metagenome]